MAKNETPEPEYEATQLCLMSIRGMDGDWLILEKPAKHIKQLMNRIKEIIEEHAIKSI